MYLNYDTEKINKVLRDFHDATGIDIDIIRSDFTPLGTFSSKTNIYCRAVQTTHEGKHKCFCSDMKLLKKCAETKKLQMHVCHAGLVDVAIPVIFENEIISYLILGQMKKDEDFERIKPLIREITFPEGINPEKLYSDLEYFNDKKMNAVASIAAIVAKYILTEDILTPGRNEKRESAMSYINQNFSGRITIDTISKDLCISKSSLYDMFRRDFGCTVGEYINSVRIKNAVSLLRTTDLQIEEISHRCGFSRASHFTRVFKEIMKTTPLKYRKNQVL